MNDVEIGTKFCEQRGDNWVVGIRWKTHPEEIIATFHGDYTKIYAEHFLEWLEERANKMINDPRVKALAEAIKPLEDETPYERQERLERLIGSMWKKRD